MKNTAKERSGNGKREKILILALILVSVCMSLGCGKTPAVDDVAEVYPNAGLIEAWNGETEMMTEAETPEEEPTGPRTMREDRYDESGTIVGYSIMEYDAQDRITLEENFDLNGVSETRWERSYSEDGREEHVLVYEANVLDTQMHNRYDENGVIREMRYLDAEGAMFMLFEYDAEGNLIGQSTYEGAAGEEYRSSDMETDDKGQVTESAIYNADGSIDFTSISEYDEQGRQIRFARRSSDGSFLADHRMIYDENGVLYRNEFYDEKGALSYYTISEFDGEGREVRLEQYNSDETLKSYTLTSYHANGKPEREEFYNGDGVCTEYRVIEYRADGRIQRSELYNGSDELTEYRRYTHNDDGTYVEYICQPTGKVLETRKYTADGQPIG